MKQILRIILLVIGVVVTTSCGGNKGAGITVDSAWMRPAAATGATGAAYLVIHNEGNTDDQLLGATSAAAAAVEIHATLEMEGMMHMAPAEGGVIIPAGGTTTLEPGGTHIMFIGLTRALNPGDMVEMILTFAQAGAITVTAEVSKE
ncbi:MAG: copper chaperone PCu(A)C [Chloroflexi bacterium]|nr:copper chaperone PCu(A)C [Chloroflexota bacterium]MBP8058374.1 copper chaperone PCu(A)C [Chloroflexota bacterium]